MSDINWMAGEIYLVKHGAIDVYDPTLTIAGQEQAKTARDELVERGLGGRAILLSSTANRALQTAEIIAEGLGVEVKQSPGLEKFGNNPIILDSLDELIEAELAKCGLEVDEQGVVAVTHAPLIAMAKKVKTSSIEYGEVFQYPPGTWDQHFRPPGYSPPRPILIRRPPKLTN